MSGRNEKLETAARDYSLEKLNYRDWRNEAGEGYEAKEQFFLLKMREIWPCLILK